ncbi:hypothetical protein BJEO58_01186 [Brevibacterium jeotgali]|uniref:Uncharacterized protein n=1 Tax=Brevibacterium jeotgali TaxID=1262550 RepID=A0A2H1L3Z4_9MICO|nr:hypothetical protein FB108_0510 [Brevibacterium jeotgali]SMY11601.1 hypothetical protein BJEO58_01186 [Brevibacterium jeotgali]
MCIGECLEGVRSIIQVTGAAGSVDREPRGGLDGERAERVLFDMLEKRPLGGDRVCVRGDCELTGRDDGGAVCVGSAVFVFRVVLDFLVVRAAGAVSAVGIVDGDLRPRDRGARVGGGFVKSSDGVDGSSSAEVQPVLRVAATGVHCLDPYDSTVRFGLRSGGLHRLLGPCAHVGLIVEFDLRRAADLTEVSGTHIREGEE